MRTDKKGLKGTRDRPPWRNLHAPTSPARALCHEPQRVPPQDPPRARPLTAQVPVPGGPAARPALAAGGLIPAAALLRSL